MKLLSVNVGLPQIIQDDTRSVHSAICKTSQTGSVMARGSGLAGDGQADLECHGGVDKAVYIFPYEHYPWFQRLLSRDDFVFGQFGENLTTAGLLEDQVRIGDRFGMGEVILEVSQPRVPCFKLGLRMGTSAVIAAMIDSLRTGFYARVVREGWLVAGNSFELVATNADNLTVQEVMRLRYLDKGDVLGALKAAALPALTPSWREEFAQRC